MDEETPEEYLERHGKKAPNLKGKNAAQAGALTARHDRFKPKTGQEKYDADAGSIEVLLEADERAWLAQQKKDKNVTAGGVIDSFFSQ